MQEFSPNSAQKLYFSPFSTQCEPFFLIFASKNKEKRPKAPLFFTISYLTYVQTAISCSRRRSRRFLFGWPHWYRLSAMLRFGSLPFAWHCRPYAIDKERRCRLADGATAKKKEPACLEGKQAGVNIARRNTAESRMVRGGWLIILRHSKYRFRYLHCWGVANLRGAWFQSQDWSWNWASALGDSSA